MGEAQEIEAGVLEEFEVAIARVVRDCVAEPGEILVAIGAAQGEGLAVEDEAELVVERERADAEAGRDGVGHVRTAPDFGLQRVEPGMVRVPQLGLGNGEVARGGLFVAGGEGG